MDANELKIILEKHGRWLRGEEGGECADLREAYLREANLCEANLRGADLREANLREANLREADLREADLREANLCEAYLRGADLCEANLCEADLREANLYEAYLREANLRGAHLCGADLRGAYLYEAEIDSKEMQHRQIVPEKGSFTAFKKLRGGCICELEIPADAKRLGGLTERKCRVSEAKVVSITEPDGTEISKAVSRHDPEFKYEVGETVKVENFCDDPREVCAPGIHCFITRLEAEEY